MTNLRNRVVNAVDINNRMLSISTNIGEFSITADYDGYDCQACEELGSFCNGVHAKIHYITRSYKKMLIGQKILSTHSYRTEDGLPFFLKNGFFEIVKIETEKGVVEIRFGFDAVHGRGVVFKHEIQKTKQYQIDNLIQEQRSAFVDGIRQRFKLGVISPDVADQLITNDLWLTNINDDDMANIEKCYNNNKMTRGQYLTFKQTYETNKISAK